jgi:hypothetical protein
VRPGDALVAVCAVVLGALALGASAQAVPRCPSGMRCGSVSVPLDRQNPSAGTIDIHYALVPHTDKTRPTVGTIVPNPGGPGQATIASAVLYTQADGAVAAGPRPAVDRCSRHRAIGRT